MDKFEYKVITNSDDRVRNSEDFQVILNKLGEKGWEMVSMVCSTGLGNSKYSLIGVTTNYVSVFKRKKLKEE